MAKIASWNPKIKNSHNAMWLFNFFQFVSFLIYFKNSMGILIQSRNQLLLLRHLRNETHRFDWHGAVRRILTRLWMPIFMFLLCTDFLPIGTRLIAWLLKCLSGFEVPLMLKVVMKLSMDRSEFLQGAHTSEAVHGALAFGNEGENSRIDYSCASPFHDDHHIQRHVMQSHRIWVYQ